MPLCYNFELNVLCDLISMNPQLDVSPIKSLDEALISYAWYRNDLLYPDEEKTVEESSHLLRNPKYQLYAPVIREICRRIKKGENLLPYLSRRKESLTSHDALLRSANIHHFHLNTKHKGDDLLYAYCDMFSPEEVYLLDIGTHKDFEKIYFWYDILFKNWPKLRNKLLDQEFLILTDTKNPSFKKYLYGSSYGVVPFDNKALFLGLNKSAMKYLIRNWLRMLSILEDWIFYRPEYLCKVAQIPYPIWRQEWVRVLTIGHNFINFILGNRKLHLQDRGYDNKIILLTPSTSEK